MKISSLATAFLLLLTSFVPAPSPEADKAEERKAFEYLNEIRLDPESHLKRLGLSKKTDVTRTALIWNDTLAKVARAKAMDMAKRNYYGHVDPDGYGINHYINKAGYKLNAKWLANKADNYFESVGVGMESGKEAVDVFIVDKDVPGLGHRNHLLGLTKWDSSLKDIGIGFARAGDKSKFKTYVCIIIAKHN